MSEIRTGPDAVVAKPQDIPTVRVYGTTWCSDCVVAKRVLEKLKVPYEWIDISDDVNAIAYVESINGGYRSVPTILFPDGQTLTEPSGRELTAALMALGYVES